MKNPKNSKKLICNTNKAMKELILGVIGDMLDHMKDVELENLALKEWIKENEDNFKKSS